MSQTVRTEAPIGGRRGLGWLPDYPDLRDFSAKHEEIGQLLAKTAVEKAKTTPNKWPSVTTTRRRSQGPAVETKGQS